MESIEVDVKDMVLKPVDQVYEAIISPKKITKYFASKSSGELREGEVIIWDFSDVGAKLSVEVVRVKKNKRIDFIWAASGKRTTVQMMLESEDTGETRIQIKEGPFSWNHEEMGMALQQTQGWTDFICSLKAYLYADLNLRAGRMEESY